MSIKGFSPWPQYTQEEADAVSRVLLSNQVNYWTGSEGKKFENEFARFSESRYAVALANGTVALDLALKVLDIGPGDEVIVTPRTFIASVSCVVNAGAIPVFVDVDRKSQNITPDAISAAITQKTRAIICVHLAGWPCEMDSIMQLAELHGIQVIEDCAQAHGARFRDRSVGSFGHLAAWSFCQDKIMTTGGEGGMLTTNSAELHEKAWSYKDHGKSWKAVHAENKGSGFRWLHDSFGTNWRMTEMQAVLGRVQLKRMPEWQRMRTRNALSISDVCSKYPEVLRVPEVPKYITHAWYKLYVFVEPRGLRNSWDRNRIVHEITSNGVPCYTGSCSEVYLEKSFDHTGYRPSKRLPVAKELGERSIMFLVHPTITESDLDMTCQVISKVIESARG